MSRRNAYAFKGSAAPYGGKKTVIEAVNDFVPWYSSKINIGKYYARSLSDLCPAHNLFDAFHSKFANQNILNTLKLHMYGARRRLWVARTGPVISEAFV